MRKRNVKLIPPSRDAEFFSDEIRHIKPNKLSDAALVAYLVDFYMSYYHDRLYLVGNECTPTLPFSQWFNSKVLQLTDVKTGRPVIIDWIKEPRIMAFLAFAEIFEEEKSTLFNEYLSHFTKNFDGGHLYESAIYHHVQTNSSYITLVFTEQENTDRNQSISKQLKIRNRLPGKYLKDFANAKKQIREQMRSESRSQAYFFAESAFRKIVTATIDDTLSNVMGCIVNVISSLKIESRFSIDSLFDALLGVEELGLHMCKNVKEMNSWFAAFLCAINTLRISRDRYFVESLLRVFPKIDQDDAHEILYVINKEFLVHIAQLEKDLRSYFLGQENDKRHLSSQAAVLSYYFYQPLLEIKQLGMKNIDSDSLNTQRKEIKARFLERIRSEDKSEIELSVYKSSLSSEDIARSKEIGVEAALRVVHQCVNSNTRYFVNSANNGIENGEWAEKMGDPFSPREKEKIKRPMAFLRRLGIVASACLSILGMSALILMASFSMGLVALPIASVYVFYSIVGGAFFAYFSGFIGGFVFSSKMRRVFIKPEKSKKSKQAVVANSKIEKPTLDEIFPSSRYSRLEQKPRTPRVSLNRFRFRHEQKKTDANSGNNGLDESAVPECR